MTAVCLFGTFSSVFCQDLITFKNGEELKAKVIELTIDGVRYKKWDNVDGPIYVTEKSKVFMIKYQNGSKDMFDNTPNKTMSPQAPQPKVNSEAYQSSGYFTGDHIVKAGYGLYGLSSGGSSESYSGIALGVERKLNPNFAIEGGLEYNWKSTSASGASATVSIFTGSVDGKYYITEAFQGLYIGGRVGYSSVDVSFSVNGSSTRASKGFLGLGALAGYQVSLSGPLYLNIRGGYGILFTSNSSAGASNSGLFNIDVQLGYRF